MNCDIRNDAAGIWILEGPASDIFLSAITPQVLLQSAAIYTIPSILNRREARRGRGCGTRLKSEVGDARQMQGCRDGFGGAKQPTKDKLC